MSGLKIVLRVPDKDVVTLKDPYLSTGGKCLATHSMSCIALGGLICFVDCRAQMNTFSCGSVIQNLENVQSFWKLASNNRR